MTTHNGRISLNRLLLGAIAFLIIMGLYHIWSWTRATHFIKPTTYLVQSRTCSIPAYSPFDGSTTRAIDYEKAARRGICLSEPAEPIIVDVERKTARWDWPTFQSAYGKTNPDDIRCMWTATSRGIPDVDKIPDDVVYLSDAVPIPPSGETKLTRDFVIVYCIDTKNPTDKNQTDFETMTLKTSISMTGYFYRNFHPLVLVNETLIAERKKNAAEHKAAMGTKFKKHLNILLLGIDSTSRNNAIRFLPKSLDFVLRHLEGLDYKGYNKVGDNTVANFVPILAGGLVVEFAPSHDPSFSTAFFDDVPLIYKDFARRGYMTMHLEDNSGTMFNYKRRGFKHPPCDVYHRPNALLVSCLWHTDNCFGQKLEHEVLFNYTLQIIETYRNDVPVFATFFPCRLTHGSVETLSWTDDSFVEAFKRLEEGGVLDDSFLFFFSDHGIRYGDARGTPLGSFEERTPFMTVVPPKWFREAFPRRWENMRANQERLVSNFDIHETLRDLLDLTNDPTVDALEGQRGEGTSDRMVVSRKAQGVSRSGGSHVLLENDDVFGVTNRVRRLDRGISLFRDIPYERSCKDAGIALHWCVCERPGFLSSFFEGSKNGKVRPPSDVAIGRAVVEAINTKLARFSPPCAVLLLKSVRAVDHVPNDDGSIVSRIEIEAVPSGGIFEATTETRNGRIEVMNDISRINKYGTQGDCITDSGMQLFCYCDSSLITEKV